VTGSEITHYH